LIRVETTTAVGRPSNYHEVRPEPTEKDEDVPGLSPYRRLVIFYAVVSDEIEQVIELFNTPAAAEAMLEEVLRDEPDWRKILYVEPIELLTGGEN